jgi:hypothetical protein
MLCAYVAQTFVCQYGIDRHVILYLRLLDCRFVLLCFRGGCAFLFLVSYANVEFLSKIKSGFLRSLRIVFVVSFSVC